MQYFNKTNFNIFIVTLVMVLCFIACQNNPTAPQAVVAKKQTPPPSNLEWVDTSKILKEQVLKDFIITAKTVVPNKKNGKPFDKMNYDKIIAYDFVGSEEPYPGVIDRHGKFVPAILAQQFLTQTQTDNILSALSKKSTYGEATAACFNPHLALVFYKNNKKVNQINICLDCNYLISEVEIPAETHKKVHEGTKDEYAITGFTKSGKSAITNLCKTLNFHYGNEHLHIR